MSFSRTAAALVATVLGVALLAAPARAESPSALDGHVVDQSSQEVLSGDTGQIEDAIDQLRSESDLDLWVVYVDSFDGASAQDWARQTADATGLGSMDLLFAVAVKDRQTGWAGSAESGLSQDQINAAMSRAQDDLAGGDWAAGAVTFADELLAAASGSGAAAGASGDSGGSSLTLVLVVLALIAAAVLAYVWWRGKQKQQVGPAREQQQAVASPPPDSLEAKLAKLSLEDLRKRAGNALVQLDDAVRSSQQELSFAEVQFGLQAIQQFQEALTTAKSHLSHAFQQQAKLEDDTPDTEEEQREYLTTIVLDCAKADSLLDEQAEAFAHLRDLRQHAPQALQDLAQRAEEIEATIPPAELALTQLHATYPGDALASISRAPEQARSLLAAAREAVQAGNADLQEDDRASAVAYARTAEGALSHAATLIESVHQGGDELQDAKGKLDDAVASIRADLIDADNLAQNDSSVQALLPRANNAISGALAAKSGGDPIAALAEITSAEDALDDALQPHREQADSDRRAQAKLGTGIARTESFIRSINDYIATNRGAVGPQARTRLDNAAQLLQQARQAQDARPRQAIELVNRSWADASRARDLAAADVNRWHTGPPVGKGYGGYGRRSGMDMGSLLLGGLIGSAIGGGFGGFGGFGGSGFGGDIGGGGGFGGGDFGGGGAF